MRHRTPTASALVCGVLLLSSCSGDVGEKPSNAEPVGPSAPTAGIDTVPSAGAHVGDGPLGSPEDGPTPDAPGTAAPAGNVAPGGTAAPVSTVAPSGTTSPADDPYAVPASPPEVVLVPTPRLARLSRKQWSNTVRDLLYLTDSDVAEIDRGVSGDALIGFDTQADALFVGEMLRRELAEAAEQLANLVTTDSTVLDRLIPADAPSDAAGRAHALVTSLGVRAFRRPLTEAEVASHLALFDQGPRLYPEIDAFNAGANLVVQAMLQSPHFLYRTELGSAAAGATQVPLNDYEIAAKLAFALTNTMPDDELFAAAAAGQLQDRGNVAAQAERLINSQRGVSGISNFQFQVFRLGTYDGITRDPDVFPDFTPQAPQAMRQEVLQFLEWIYTEGLGVKDFYTAAVGFVNADLAPLYGLEGNFSRETFEMVDLDPNVRSGLLTQAGFLSSYITGTQPDIIHRGVFIATRLLCIELPPPDPNAMPITELDPNLTNRERVESVTGKGTCGEGCHVNLLNPLGYAFEGYDPIGKVRTMDNGKPVDTADSYRLDGELESFANGVELSHLLAETKQVHNCYVRNMMTYLNGRTPTREEEPWIDYFARLSRAGMASLRDLQLAFVTSDAFLNRLP